MTNQIAIGLGIVIFLAIGIDAIAYDGEGMFFLLRKFAQFIEWLAFWR